MWYYVSVHRLKLLIQTANAQKPRITSKNRNAIDGKYMPNIEIRMLVTKRRIWNRTWKYFRVRKIIALPLLLKSKSRIWQSWIWNIYQIINWITQSLVKQKSRCYFNSNGSNWIRVFLQKYYSFTNA